MIYLARLKHALGTDGAPYLGSGVGDFRTSAGETLFVRRGTEIRDVAHHPAQNTHLRHGSEDCGVYLPEKEDAGWDLHVLAELEVLSEIHSVLHAVVAVTLDHHVGDGLSGEGVSSDEFSDDIEEADRVSCDCSLTKRMTYTL